MQMMQKYFAKILETLGYRIVAGGTDNHMFIVDLRSKNITGRQAEMALEKAGITTSRSCIPYDPEKPWITSGIRIGTPAITTRGINEAQIEIIANLVDEVVQKCKSEACLLKIKDKVKEICAQFPIYKK